MTLKNLELIDYRWLGHALHVDESKLPKQAQYWGVDTAKWKPGRPRKNWMNTISQDLKEMELTWEEAQQLSVNTEEWY